MTADHPQQNAICPMVSATSLQDMTSDADNVTATIDINDNLPAADDFDQFIFGIDELLDNDDDVIPLKDEPRQHDLNIVASIAPEFLPMVWQLDNLLRRIGDSEPTAVTEYIDACRRLGEAADIVGATALRTIFLFLAVEMRECVLGHFDDGGFGFRLRLQRIQHALAEWFSCGGNGETAEQIEVLFNDEPWHQGDFAVQLPNLCAALQALSEQSLPDKQEKIPLRRSDYQIAVPQDVQESLYETFLQEAPVHVEAIAEALQHLSTSHFTADSYHALLRTVHTLKGSAATAGVTAIMQLCHLMEELIDRHNEEQSPLSIAELRCLAEANDGLAEMIDFLSGQGESPRDSWTLAKNIAAQLQQCDVSVIEAVDDIAIAEPADKPKADLSNDNMQTQHAMRVSIQAIDHLLRSGSELTTLSAHAEDHYRHLQTVSHALEQLSTSLQKRMIDLEHLADISATPFVQQQQRGDNDFDPLELDQYNELHGQLRGLAESVSDVNELSLNLNEELSSFRAWYAQQQHSNRHLQQQLLSMRMTSVGTLLPRLERCVRQASRLTEKSAQLSCTGTDTLVDVDILDRIADPLVHLLRNAVDHGIESQALRLARHKPLQGHIHLKFSREGNYLLIRCEDDGGGLDYDRIRQTAIARQLIAADAFLDESQLAQLILQPGFSTRDEVTTTSGRGFGMDIVYSVVTQLGGQVQIQSQTGIGCCTTLRLPLTMISMHILLLRCAGQLFAIPSNMLTQIILPDPERYEMHREQRCYRHGDQLLEVIALHECVQTNAGANAASNDNGPAVIYRDFDDKPYLIQIDEVLSCREVVLKRFGKYLRNAQGSLGMAQMSDGTLICVLDPAHLVRAQHVVAMPQTLTTDNDSQLSRILVVEDSLSTRRALQQLIEDAGYEVRTAKDGLEALETLQQWPADAVLTDLEMPRLNGLELTAQLRSGKRHQLPIIMLTSRSTQKHREQALQLGVQAYLSKPFSDTDVLVQIERVLERSA